LLYIPLVTELFKYCTSILFATYLCQASKGRLAR